MKWRIGLGLVLLWLTVLSTVGLSGCAKENRQPQDALFELSQILKTETSDGLRLKIYFIDPSIYLSAPLTPDRLIQICENSGSYTHKIVVYNDNLKAHSDLLNDFCSVTLVPVDHPSSLAARLCYIFETEKGRAVIEVAVGGSNNSVFLNGVEFENDELFYDVLKPYLTEEELSDIYLIFSEKRGNIE